MERRIGDTFEHEGKTLKVVENKCGLCDGCFFMRTCNVSLDEKLGFCEPDSRSDNKKVIFVEVQPKQTEKPKELKIGESFVYKGRKLKAIEKEGIDDCDGRVLFKEDYKRVHDFVGECEDARKRIVFVDADEFDDCQLIEEEPHQKLNLCELLRHCPENEQFWSPMLGDVIFYDINQSDGIVRVEMENGEILEINSDGTITICGITSPEIMLYPSREQRDWSKVNYETIKEKFDPKTLNAFDKVIARKDSEDSWNIDFFSCLKLKKIPLCLGGIKCAAIPYNDDTKHLVGTTDDAPEFYRYWED